MNTIRFITLFLTFVCLPSYCLSPSMFYGRGEVRAISSEANELNFLVNKMRFGAKDHFDLTYLKKINAFYHMEWEYNANESDGSDGTPDSSTARNFTSVRKALLGIDGSFGAIIMGRQGNPAYSAYKNDVFKNGSAKFVNTRARIGSSLVYYSPEFYGVKLSLAAIADDTENNHKIDSSVLGLHFKSDIVDAVIATTSTSKEYLGGLYNKQIINLGVKYHYKLVTFLASFEDATLETGLDEELIALAMVFTQRFINYKVGYEVSRIEDDVDKSQWIIHAGMKLAPRVDVYIQYNTEEDGNETINTSSAGLNIVF